MSHVAQVHALAGLVLILVAALVAQRDRHHEREARLDAALWADLHGTRGLPIPLARPEALALGMVTAPTNTDLHTWLMSTDEAPVIYQCRPGAGYRPSDDRVCHHKPRTNWRPTTDEVRALVEAG